jgi:hypothetical protein
VLFREFGDSGIREFKELSLLVFKQGKARKMVSTNNQVNDKLNYFFKLNKKEIKTPRNKTEIANVNRLKYLLGNPSVIGEDKLMLEKYLKKVKHGKVDVTYVVNKDCDKDRIYPKGGVGLAPMNKELRSFLAEEIYADADIENSHPRLLYALCQLRGIDCPEVTKIVKHREEYLQGVMDELGCNRGEAKQYVNASINGCGDFQDSECLGVLYNEMRNLRIFVKSEYPEIYRDASGELTAFNTVLSFFELKLMIETHDELIKMGWEIDTLIHDGFLVRKNHKRKRNLTDDLALVSDVVRVRTGLELYDMRVKDFVEHGFNDSGPVELDINHSDLATYALRYFRNNGKELVYVNGDFRYDDGLGFKRVLLEHIASIVGLSNMNNSFLDYICSNFDGELFNKVELTKRLKTNGFCNDVVSVIKRSCTKDTYFDPYKNDPDTNKLNMFRRFKATKLDRVVEYSEVAIFLDHIKTVICGGNEAYFKHVVQWHAYLLRFGRNHTSIVVFGEEGDGKSLPGAYFGEWIIGSDYYHSDSSIDNVFGKHNGVRHERMYIQMEEMKTNKDSFAVYDSAIKNAITCDVMNLRLMYCDVESVRCFNNFYMTSNNRIPMIISDKDRRHSCFESSNVYQGDTVYFKNLIATIECEEFANALFTWFLQVDLSDYSPNKKMDTDIAKQMAVEGSSVGLYVKALKDGEYEHLYNENAYLGETRPNSINSIITEIRDSGAYVTYSEDLFNSYLTFAKRRNHHSHYRIPTFEVFVRDFKKMFGNCESIRTKSKNKIRLVFRD